MNWVVGALAVALVVISVVGVRSYRHLDDQLAHARTINRDNVALLCQIAVDPEQPLATEPNTGGKEVVPGTERAVIEAYVNQRAVQLSSICSKARKAAAEQD